MAIFNQSRDRQLGQCLVCSHGLLTYTGSRQNYKLSIRLIASILLDFMRFPWILWHRSQYQELGCIETERNMQYVMSSASHKIDFSFISKILFRPSTSWI
uniref:Uncharacterized protein n=1 Tax=Opuntia streptacantha TaxID=393608 RepID=A0A7C9EE10_OPUST